jgi:hypothetical protein
MSKPCRKALKHLHELIGQRLGKIESGDEDDLEQRTLTPPSTEKGSTKAEEKDGDTEMLL